jgi:dTDP-4-amino-4,6-dideoxygalactose transaminase
MLIIPRQFPCSAEGSLKDFLTLLWRRELVRGEMIEKYEKEFAACVGAKYAFSLSSARLGLYILLKVMKIKEGDDVILPSFTCPVVPSIVEALGANPVFVDSDPESFNIDASGLERCITNNSKAIIATHIEGMPCDMDEINRIAKKYKIKVIEDCAQAFGAKYNGKNTGTLGDAAYFSFGIGKQINTMGGGMILTDDDNIAGLLREEIKNYKYPGCISVIKKYVYQSVVDAFLKFKLFNIFVYPVILLSNIAGKDLITVLFEDSGSVKNLPAYKTKYSNLQAAFGSKRLKDILADNLIRIRNAEYISALIGNSINHQKGTKEAGSVYWYYSLVYKNRKKLKLSLLFKGIDTQESWNVACNLKPIFKKYYKPCPVAERLEREVLYIPIYPRLSSEELVYITDNLIKAVQ